MRRLSSALVVAAWLTGAAAWAWKGHGTHRPRSFEPDGAPFGAYVKGQRPRIFTVYGPKPVWNDAAGGYILPKYGTAATLYYSAYKQYLFHHPCGDPVDHDDDDGGISAMRHSAAAPTGRLQTVPRTGYRIERYGGLNK